MLRIRAKKGVLKDSYFGGGCASINEARRGSTLRRWVIAASSSPSQVRDFAWILGGCDGLPFAEGLDDVTASLLGESFLIFRGRSGILEGGEEDTLLSSVILGASMVVDETIEPGTEAEEEEESLLFCGGIGLGFSGLGDWG